MISSIIICTQWVQRLNELNLKEYIIMSEQPRLVTNNEEVIKNIIEEFDL